MNMKIAVLTNCTSSSSIPVVPYLDGSALGDGYTHTSAAEEWKRRIDRARTEQAGLSVVRSLYTGVSFRTIIAAMDSLHGSADIDPSLYIVSLGFGLVNADDTIASYNLNMQEPEQSPSTLLNIVTEESFDPVRWWGAINRSVHGIEAPIGHLIQDPKIDLILVALTNNFLHLCAADIASQASTEAFRKLRIVGPRGTNWMLKYMRYIAKKGVIMPYSPQLNDIMPGNRLDFAQRAATHFIRDILIPTQFAVGGGPETHFQMVADIFGVAANGQTINDEALQARISDIQAQDPDVTSSEVYVRLVSNGVQIKLDKFQRMWGMQHAEEATSDEVEDAMAALSSINIIAGFDDQGEVVSAIRLFVEAIRTRGGGKFQVGDLCNWAKLYYDRRQKPIPLTLTSRPKVGHLLPSLVKDLHIVRTENSVGQKIYEVLP